MVFGEISWVPRRKLIALGADEARNLRILCSNALIFGQMGDMRSPDLVPPCQRALFMMLWSEISESCRSLWVL